MNGLPPLDNGPEDIDEYYRRLSTHDPGRPTETLRKGILAHAAQMAAERSSQRGARQGSGGRRASWRAWKPAFVGSLLAVSLAGILITPNLRAPVSSINENASGAAKRSDAAPKSAAGPTEVQTLSENAQRMAKPSLAPAPSSQAAPPEMASALTPLPAYSDSTARVGKLAAASAEFASPASARGVALRRAAQAGDIAAVRLLLDQHAPLEERDAGGRTALMLATLSGQVGAVRELLAFGADPGATDAQGLTPLRAAESKNYQGIAALLKRAAVR